MMLRSLRILLTTAALAAPVFAAEPVGNPPEAPRLFAAMIMTKAQQASSIPTDSGVLLRDPATGAWERLGPAIQMISSATADPSDPARIFYACGNGIARSLDSGRTWRLVTGWRESDVLQIAIDPHDGDHVYAASAWGVTVSRDGGDSWTAANDGLREYFSRAIVVDQRDPTRLLLGTSTGLFESGDRAATWQRIESFPNVAVLRLRRSDLQPNRWIAGTEGEGVWLSDDDGRNWKRTAPRLAAANVYAVAIDPFDADRLAAGGWGTGVWISTDGGLTWTPRREGLPSLNITAMQYDVRAPDRLWVSTFEEGTVFTDDDGRDWGDGDLDGAYVFDLGFLPDGE